MKYVAVLALFLTGCSFGPKYQRPNVAPPVNFRGAQTASTESLGDAQWWTVFQDEELQKLIRTALAENLDVRIAAARWIRPRRRWALLALTSCLRFKRTGSAGRQRNPSNPVFPAFEANLSQLGLSAVWQLDFWGRYRKATEAARASLVASQWGQKAIIGSLVSNVATAYFQLRALDLELEIAKRTLGTRQEALGLNRTLEQGGAISLIDVHQAEILVEQAAVQIPDIERRIAQQENLISVLLGRNPDSITRGKPWLNRRCHPPCPPGCPRLCWNGVPIFSRQRRNWSPPTPRIGVAKAAYFPQISHGRARGSRLILLPGSSTRRSTTSARR